MKHFIIVYKEGEKTKGVVIEANDENEALELLKEENARKEIEIEILNVEEGKYRG